MRPSQNICMNPMSNTGTLKSRGQKRNSKRCDEEETGASKSIIKIQHIITGFMMCQGYRDLQGAGQRVIFFKTTSKLNSGWQISSTRASVDTLIVACWVPNQITQPFRAGLMTCRNYNMINGLCLKCPNL